MLTKATILFSLKMVARYLTEKRRFEPQNTVKIKCSQLSCDQPPQLLITVTLGTISFFFFFFYEIRTVQILNQS